MAEDEALPGYQSCSYNRKLQQRAVPLWFLVGKLRITSSYFGKELQAIGRNRKASLIYYIAKPL